MESSKQKRQYKRPPIEEALVEFQMAPGQEWDLTIPGKMHEKMRDAYPGKPRQQKLMQATIQAGPSAQPGFSMQEGIGRVQLVDHDAKKLVSLGPNVLSINVLKPYDGWHNFRPRICAALDCYQEVSGANKISRIGVRYINRVVIPNAEISLEEYFLCAPSFPRDLPRELMGFMHRTELAYDDGARLILTFASIESEPDYSAFLLDLDVILECAEPLDINTALAKADCLHEYEGRAFEALITDKTRAIFDAD